MNPALHGALSGVDGGTRTDAAPSSEIMTVTLALQILLAQTREASAGRLPEHPQRLPTALGTYVAKFPRRESGRQWREYVSALVAWILFGQRVSARQLRTGDIRHEANRLRELAAAGIRVPRVVLETPDALVMPYCGESVDTLLRRQLDEALLHRVVAALRQLHQVGQWHGAAQLRNMTVLFPDEAAPGDNPHGLLYRIDFEENTGNAMPLALAQAYDVLLCFNSLAPHIGHDVALGTHLLTTYLQSINNQAIITYLKRAYRVLCRLQGIFSKHLYCDNPNQDIKNTLYFTQLLKQISL